MSRRLDPAAGLGPASSAGRTQRPPAAPRRAARRPLPRRALRAGLGAAALLAGVFGSLTAYAALTLPNVDDIGRATGTIRLLDRHGTLIAEVDHAHRHRTRVQLDQVAQVMQDATLSAEDRSFYDEAAVNIPRVLHAIFIDILSRSPDQGGSTITQQLAKRAFLSPDRSPLRKLREALLANQIGSRYSKREILEMYLNVIDYGQGAQGVEDAARTYFGKHASQLDLREAALLAGVPQAPALNDPLTHPDTAYGRMHYVLSGLVATGHLAQPAADAVDPLAGADHPVADQAALRERNQAAIAADLRNGRPSAVGQAPHFVAYAEQEVDGLIAERPGELTGDLDVVTSLDLPIQHQAESAVARGVPGLGRGANNGALVMIDPASGGVTAMVGSVGFDAAAVGGQFNVTTAQRRPGSTFKPIVYAQGFRSGRLGPRSQLDDTAEESARLGGVQNVDRQFLGPMPAGRALLLSRNVPAEQAMLITGVHDTVELAHQLGIGSPLAENPSTAIGASAIRPIDEAAAFAAFANGGHAVSPHAVVRVTGAGGSVLLDRAGTAGGPEVLTARQDGQLNGILRGYAHQWGLGFARPTAGKSGTTDDSVDAWYTAYTPDWVVTTWAGHTDAASPAEVPMDGVGGNDVAAAIAVPFVNGLPPSRDFSGEAAGDCFGACSVPGGRAPRGGEGGD